MTQSHELHTSNRAVPSHGGHIWELNGGVPSRSAGSPNKNAGVNVSCPPPLSPSSDTNTMAENEAFGFGPVGCAYQGASKNCNRNAENGS